MCSDKKYLEKNLKKVNYKNQNVFIKKLTIKIKMYL